VIDAGTLDVTAKDGDTAKNVTLDTQDNKIGTFKGEGATVKVKDTDGDLALGNVTAAGGDMKITAAGGDITVNNGATISSTKSGTEGGNVVLTANGDVNVNASTVSAGDNLLLEANGANGNVTIDPGVTMTAAQNATISANQNVNINSDVKATARDAYVEAKNGNVTMAAGTKITAGHNAYLGAENGQLTISKVDAEQAAWLKTGGDIQNVSIDGVHVEAKELRLEAGGNVGQSSSGPLLTDVEKIEAVAQTGSVNIKEKDDVAIGGVGSDNGGVLTVNHVEQNGQTSNNQPTDNNPLAGISANGDVSVASDGKVTIDEAVTAGGDVVFDAKNGLAINAAINAGGSTSLDTDGSLELGAAITAGNLDLKAGGDVAFNGGSANGGSVSVDAGGNITQSGANITASGGYADQNENIPAAIDAGGGSVTLKAGGSIGKAEQGSSDYVGVKAGSLAATAGGDVAIAGAGGSDLKITSIDAGNSVSVYTTGTIIPDGQIKAEKEAIVTAGNFTGGIVDIDAGKKLTVNNFRNGSYQHPLLAIFNTKSGGNTKPDISNFHNDTIVFIDGRVAGGDIQTINKLGAMEAFPVQTPELKSEQGVFGNPLFLHDELDVANPLAVGAIDFLLQDYARLSYGSEFPIEADTQVAATGLNPTTSYWCGQKSEGSDEADKGDAKKEESARE